MIKTSFIFLTTIRLSWKVFSNVTTIFKVVKFMIKCLKSELVGFQKVELVMFPDGLDFRHLVLSDLNSKKILTEL